MFAGAKVRDQFKLVFSNKWAINKAENVTNNLPSAETQKKMWPNNETDRFQQKWLQRWPLLDFQGEMNW